MNKKTVYIKYEFSTEEVLTIRAKEPKAICCDKNNFNFIDFSDKDVKAAAKDKKTSYLVAKAKGENPEAVTED